jgi:hypothetical protein
LFGEGLILGDLSIKLELKFLLGLLHKEVPDCFRHRISNVPDHNLEVGINSQSDLSNECVTAGILLLLPLGGGRLLLLAWLLLLRAVLLLFLNLRDDISPVG